MSSLKLNIIKIYKKRGDYIVEKKIIIREE